MTYLLTYLFKSSQFRNRVEGFHSI